MQLTVVQELTGIHHQYLPYDKIVGTYSPKKIKTAFIYTMGVPNDRMASEIIERLKPIEDFISRTFDFPIEILYSYNAYQFDDYSKFEASVFSLEEKIKHRQDQFPIDSERAFNLGVKLVSSNS